MKKEEYDKMRLEFLNREIIIYKQRGYICQEKYKLKEVKEKRLLNFG